MIEKLLSGGITGIMKGFSGVAGTVTNAISRRRLQKFGSQENREQREHTLNMAQIKTYMSELKPVGSWIDTVGRIPRPLMTFLVITYLLIFCISPGTGISIAKSMREIPDSLWYIIMGVFGFYFTFRTIDKAVDARKKMTDKQFDELKTNIDNKQNEIHERLMLENVKISNNLKQLIDLDSDGIDDRALKQLKTFEGYSEKLYKCPAGKNTIGYGTNLDAGIDNIEAEYLLRHRFKKAIVQVQKKLPWITEHSIARQYIVYDMCYNMGWSRLSQFQRFFTRLAKKEYFFAAREMQKSRWYTQTGIRAEKLVKQMRTGKFA